MTNPFEQTRETTEQPRETFLGDFMHGIDDQLGLMKFQQAEQAKVKEANQPALETDHVGELAALNFAKAQPIYSEAQNNKFEQLFGENLGRPHAA